jgi:hypothetical protein
MDQDPATLIHDGFRHGILSLDSVWSWNHHAPSLPSKKNDDGPNHPFRDAFRWTTIGTVKNGAITGRDEV